MSCLAARSLSLLQPRLEAQANAETELPLRLISAQDLTKAVQTQIASGVAQDVALRVAGRRRSVYAGIGKPRRVGEVEGIHSEIRSFAG